MLIEWSEVVSVILKEGRLPVAAHQRVPVLVAPVSVVADAYVLGGGMAAGLHDGNAQRERPLRTVDETAVAQGLPPIVVAHLCQSLSGVQQGAVVRGGSQIAAGQKQCAHGFPPSGLNVRSVLLQVGRVARIYPVIVLTEAETAVRPLVPHQSVGFHIHAYTFV